MFGFHSKITALVADGGLLLTVESVASHPSFSAEPPVNTNNTKNTHYDSSVNPQQKSVGNDRYKEKNNLLSNITIGDGGKAALYAIKNHLKKE